MPEAVASRWIVLARRLWVPTAILAVGVLLASVPTYLVALGTDFSADILPPDWSLTTGYIIETVGRVTSLGSSLLSVALAVLLFTRRKNDSVALLVSYFLLFYGVTFTGPAERLELTLTGGTDIALSAMVLLMTVPMALIFSLFPNGRFEPAWTRWLTVLSPIWIAVYLALPLSELENIQPGLLQALLVVWIALIVVPMLYAQIYRYRQISTPAERQQTKWVLYGLGLWIVLVSASSFPYLTVLSLPPGTPPPPSTIILGTLWWIIQAIVPVSLTVALLRYRLWEIDALIKRTLVYGFLTVILAIVYFLAVVSLQLVFRRLTGQSSPVAVVISTLMIAALFNPLRERLQAFINRRFYRSRYSAVQALNTFTESVRDEVDLERMQSALMSAVEQTLHPTHMSIWVRDELAGATFGGETP